MPERFDDFVALRHGGPGVEYQEPVAENGFDALLQLFGNGDFRYEIEYVPAGGQLLGGQLEIKLGLAAAGGPVQQHRFAGGKALTDLCECGLLAFGQGIERVSGRPGRFRGFALPPGSLCFFELVGLEHLALQAGIIGGLEHFAGRTEIVIGDGMPESQLIGRNGRLVQYGGHRLDRREADSGGCALVHPLHDTERRMPAQGHLHPTARHDFAVQPVSQRLSQFQRQQHLDISLLHSHSHCVRIKFLLRK